METAAAKMALATSPWDRSQPWAQHDSERTVMALCSTQTRLGMNEADWMMSAMRSM